MLKVIDNYDLSHLKDYGFKHFDNGYYNVWEIDNWNSYLSVDLDKRTINVGIEDYTDIEINVLYDMIKDGIVEKAEDYYVEDRG